jgi:hypothetical protein
VVLLPLPPMLLLAVVVQYCVNLAAFAAAMAGCC